ncbi:AMP-binding protein, partial [Mycobacterium sp. E342]|uniref:AMP-binding protein n=1 Tax=Mycobacterium sp. E342 TaxID=1834147 RepID=UPI000B2808A0
WQHHNPTDLGLGELQANPIPVQTHTARMDLTFSLTENFTDAGQPAGIAGTVEFRTDVSDPNSVELLIQRFQRVLTEMAADPSRLLSSVEVLDVDEQARLAVWGNRGVLDRPAMPTVSIPDVFAAQVARTPDALALTCDGLSLTYRELDAAANRLAHWLIRHGAGPGQRVGLLVPRCAQAVVAILAVLKSGAAYVPMDPGWPAARIGFLLTDAAPVAVLTTAELRSRLDGHGVAVIDVNDPVIEAQLVTALPGPAPEDVAYLIYTSGTTGVPKGVAITHGNVAQLIDSLDAGLGSGRVWTQCHSYAFDFSVWEIFGALLGGGRLVVVPESVTASPEALHALLVGERVSVLTQTPSAAGALWPQGVESVALLVGGEPCPAEVVNRWAPGRVMVNAYG